MSAKPSKLPNMLHKCNIFHPGLRPRTLAEPEGLPPPSPASRYAALGAVFRPLIGSPRGPRG